MEMYSHPLLPLRELYRCFFFYSFVLRCFVLFHAAVNNAIFLPCSKNKNIKESNNNNSNKLKFPKASSQKKENNKPNDWMNIHERQTGRVNTSSLYCDYNLIMLHVVQPLQTYIHIYLVLIPIVRIFLVFYGVSNADFE